jgi:hypothetical protein
MAEPNIYHAVVFNLHPKVRELLDALDLDGQIDQDENSAPHITSVDKMADSVYRCMFQRNGRTENFVIHTRRKAEPVRSWRHDDGWKRPARVEPPAEDSEGSRRERDRRADESVFESIMEQILPKR